MFLVDKDAINPEIPKPPTFALKFEPKFLMDKDGNNIPIKEEEIHYTPEELKRITIIRDKVHKLRELTGCGMIDCKRALLECDLDIELAI